MASPTAAWLPNRAELAPESREPRAPQLGPPLSAEQLGQPAQARGPETRRFRFGSEDRPDPDPPLGAGSMIGDRYQILRLLGEGGMGRVYEAQHIVLRRRVALKLLRRDADARPELGSNGAEPESLVRFRQEALAASRIGAPEIVEVVDFASQAIAGRQQTYMVMELLVGESLEDWMARDAQLVDGLAILASLCDGLAAAHRADVVHRDIKPANVFLPAADPTVSNQPRVKILDFGIAKITGAVEGFQTRQGSLLGTPYYLAPERIMGAELTGAADIYSVGVILYEMLTGVVPFVADSFMGILANHVHTAPLDPRQAAPDRPIPEPVAQLCLRLLSKGPRERPRAPEVAAELRELLARGGSTSVMIGPRASGLVGGDTQVLADHTRELPIADEPKRGTQIGHMAAAEPSVRLVVGSRDDASAQPSRWARGLAIGVSVVIGVALISTGLWFYSRDDEAEASEGSVEPVDSTVVEPAANPSALAAEPLEPVPDVRPPANPVSPFVAEAVEPEPVAEPTSRESRESPSSKPSAKPKPTPKHAPDPTPSSEPATPDPSEPEPKPDPTLPTIKDDVYD